MLEQIVRLAEAIVQPSEAEQPLLTALCEAAEAELARRLGISESTVATRVLRGRAMLRDRLEKEGYHDDAV